MQIAPAAFTALVPVAAGVARAVGETSMKFGSSFLEVLQNTSSDVSQPQSADPSSDDSRNDSSPTGALKRFSDNLRHWLRQAGVRGPINLRLSATGLDEVSTSASGDNAKQIENLLEENSSWFDQLRTMAIDFRSVTHVGATFPFGNSADEDQRALTLHLTEDRETTHWSQSIPTP